MGMLYCIGLLHALVYSIFPTVFKTAVIFSKPLLKHWYFGL